MPDVREKAFETSHTKSRISVLGPGILLVIVTFGTATLLNMAFAPAAGATVGAAEVAAIHPRQPDSHSSQCGSTHRRNQHMSLFGPYIRGAHAPGERVEIASVERCWDLLRAVLFAQEPVGLWSSIARNVPVEDSF